MGIISEPLEMLKKERSSFAFKGNAYFGQATAIGTCGGEVVIIAPTLEILERVWGKLGGIQELNPELVEETFCCGTRKLEKR